MFKRRKKETVERWRVKSYRDTVYYQAQQMADQAIQADIITFKAYLEGQRDAQLSVAKFLTEFVLQESYVLEEKFERPGPGETR